MVHFLGKGIIELKRLSAQAHEFGHILVADSFLKNNIPIDNMPEWLNEGIVNYLDIAYSGLVADTVFVKDEYDINQTLRPMDEGNYNDYHLNQIFTNYLIHEYGLEKLLYLMAKISVH